jgi:hypothetical protein
MGQQPSAAPHIVTSTVVHLASHVFAAPSSSVTMQALSLLHSAGQSAPSQSSAPSRLPLPHVAMAVCGLLASVPEAVDMPPAPAAFAAPPSTAAVRLPASLRTTDAPPSCGI